MTSRKHFAEESVTNQGGSRSYQETRRRSLAPDGSFSWLCPVPNREGKKRLLLDCLCSEMDEMRWDGMESGEYL
jgi:hypothetical protein